MAKDFVNVKLDTAAFDAMLVEVSKYTGATFKDVIEFEAGRILGTTIKNTKKADKGRIVKRYTYKEGADNKYTVRYIYVDGKREKIRTHQRYGVMVQLKKGPTWKPDKANPMYRKIQSSLKRKREKEVKRIGLSKGTWIAIAQQLKIRDMIVPKPPKYAATAAYSAEKRVTGFSDSISGKVLNRKDPYVIEIKNSSKAAMSPISKKGSGGRKAFADAYQGRISGFDFNVALGVFNTAKKMQRKYKGIVVVKPQGR